MKLRAPHFREPFFVGCSALRNDSVLRGGAANGNRNAPVHRLDKRDMQAAGKVIVRADHPAKAATGYAVTEATYAGGKKAYFDHEHGRYSADSSSPIKEGAHVYMTTTTHPKPMMIKAEYIQTLIEGRSPQIPRSADCLAKGKNGRPGADEKGDRALHLMLH